MTREDMRKRTRIVIRKDGEYLTGMDALGFTRWSPSAWDAWSTREIREAWMVCRKLGAEMWLFNPIVAQITRANEERLAEIYIEGQRRDRG